MRIHALLADKQLGSKFKMHGVEVIPFAAPDKTVLFEDRDDLRGHAVAIDDGATAFVASPAALDKLVIEQTEKWDKVIRAANIKVD